MRIKNNLRFLLFPIVLTIFVPAIAQNLPFRLKQNYLSGIGNNPVLVTNAGDGSRRLFVVEQAGVIKVVQPGSTSPTVFMCANKDVRVIRGCDGKHRESMVPRSRCTVCLVRRVKCGKKVKPIESEKIDECPRNIQMPVMDRVECSAKKCDSIHFGFIRLK